MATREKRSRRKKELKRAHADLRRLWVLMRGHHRWFDNHQFWVRVSWSKKDKNIRAPSGELLFENWK